MVSSDIEPILTSLKCNCSLFLKVEQSSPKPEMKVLLKESSGRMSQLGTQLIAAP